MIGIIGLLSTVMLANFRRGNQQKEIRLATDGVIQAIRLAQTYTLEGKQLPGVTRVSYFQFEVSTNARYADVRAKDSSVMTPISISQFNFPSNTRVVNNNGITLSCPSSCTTNPSTVWVRFIPPFARMQVSTDSGTSWASFNSVDIILQHDVASYTKTIRIDGISGKIGTL